MDPSLFLLSQPGWTSRIKSAGPKELCRNGHKLLLRQARMMLEISSRFLHMLKNYKRPSEILKKYVAYWGGPYLRL